MIISGLVKTSLVDYPGVPCTTIFTPGCNLSCPFCHNRSLVVETGSSLSHSIDDILHTLSKRIRYIQAICITGGEPTLQKELIPFMERVKELGIKIKLDTNGTHPKMLREVIRQQLTDYIAMDIKNSKERYLETAGNDHLDIALVEESISILKNTSVPYEFRTTLVKEFHTAEDIIKIGHWIQGANLYILQNYSYTNNQVSPFKFTSYTKNEVEWIVDNLKCFCKITELRGFD